MKALSIYHQNIVFQMFPRYLISEAMGNTQLLIKYINTYTSESNISFNPLRCTYRILTYDIQAHPLHFFYVLLTVHPSIILVINQLNAQILVL